MDSYLFRYFGAAPSHPNIKINGFFFTPWLPCLKDIPGYLIKFLVNRLFLDSDIIEDLSFRI